MGAPTRVEQLRSRRARRLRRRAGLALVVIGMALLAAVGYQVWGTGIQTSHAQTAFRREIRVHGFPTGPIPGGAVGFIRIPAIGLDMAFVQGVTPDALATGPGHYPGTPLPGAGGNVAIAGHRTTYLHPFWGLSELHKGDVVVLQTRAGTFNYRVLWRRVFSPYDWSAIAPTTAPALTLTTCNPIYHGSERLIVRAVLIQALTPTALDVEVTLA